MRRWEILPESRSYITVSHASVWKYMLYRLEQSAYKSSVIPASHKSKLVQKVTRRAPNEHKIIIIESSSLQHEAAHVPDLSHYRVTVATGQSSLSVTLIIKKDKEMDLFCLHQNYKEDACCQKAMRFFPPCLEVYTTRSCTLELESVTQLISRNLICNNVDEWLICWSKNMARSLVALLSSSLSDVRIYCFYSASLWVWGWFGFQPWSDKTSH